MTVDKHNDIFLFLKKEIDDNFISIADLYFGEKIKEIYKNNHQVYMLAVFSVPLHLFSIIEGLAGLYSGKNKKKQVDKKDVIIFYKKYFSEYYKNFKNDDFCDDFLICFRHGLAHSWSPSTSISFNFKNRGELFIDDVNKMKGLNFICFYNIFKNVFNNYKNDLKNSKKLRDNFKKRFKFLSNSYYLTANKFNNYF
jgi:hypothetical protein